MHGVGDDDNNVGDPAGVGGRVTELWQVVLVLPLLVVVVVVVVVTGETVASAAPYMGSRCCRCGCGSDWGGRRRDLRGGRRGQGTLLRVKKWEAGVGKVSDALEMGRKFNKEMYRQCAFAILAREPHGVYHVIRSHPDNSHAHRVVPPPARPTNPTNVPSSPSARSSRRAG